MRLCVFFFLAKEKKKEIVRKELNLYSNQGSSKYMFEKLLELSVEYIPFENI